MTARPKIVVAAIVVFCAVLAAASAASLGGVSSRDLYSSSQPELRCTPTVAVSTSGSPFTTATVSGYPAGCVGQVLQVTLRGAGGVALASGTATMTSPSTALTLSASVTAASVVGASAIINMLGVPATYSNIPAPPVTSTSFFLRNTIQGGATTRQSLMPITPTVDPLPSAALPNYSTDVDARPGRFLSLTGASSTAVWTTANVTSPTTFAGNSTVTMFVRRMASTNGRAIMTARIDILNAAGGVVSTNTGTAQTAPGNPGANPAWETLTFTVPTAGTVPVGGRVRLTLTTTNRTADLGYDTTTYPAQLVLPAAVATPPLASLGATFVQTLTSDFGTGYCADVTVSTTAPWPVTWNINLDLSTFPFNGVPSSVSNATWSYNAGTKIMNASGVGFNNTVTAGAPVVWSYCANRPPPPPGVATIVVTITSDFGTGYCATAAVTTTLPTPITWSGTVDLSTPPVNGYPYSVWNATWSYTALTASMAVSGAGFNDVIDAANPTSFGFCANRPVPGAALWTFAAGSLAPVVSPAGPPGFAVSPITQGPGVGIFGVMNNDSGTLTPDVFAYPNQPQIRWGSAGTAATPAAAVSAGTYIQWTVTAPSAGAVKLSSVNFDVGRGGGSAPRGVVLRSSADGYTTDLLVSDVAAIRNSMQPFSVNVSSVAQFGASSTVTFRLYLYAPAAGATLEVDNLTVNYTTIS